ncbi:peroxisomal biogenesis factor 6-like [Oryza brachyantha]|uniref:AAA+ ATPase domain-containing protein n=1 Tax=Oryza brachyantha TaxID=4533 RepID=J3MA64_ORYBR|nr:peroxisomal biogenesis factor 6-like [Oryza brachyantha]
MEQRNLFVSALGVGVGVGLGLASARWTAPGDGEGGGARVGVGVAELEAELRRLVVDGRESDVTFDEFRYYLSERTKEVLISGAFVHLKQADLSKHIRNLCAASRAILLAGPTEPYLQSLARALSHYYKTHLLILDVTDFSLRIQSKYGSSSKGLVHNQSISDTTFGRMSDLIGSFTIFSKSAEPRESLQRHTSSADVKARGSEATSNAPPLRKSTSVSSDMSDVSSQCSAHSVSARRTSSWCFDEKVLVQSLYKVMVSVAENHPVILYIRDVDHLLHRSQRTYSLFQKMLGKLSGQVLILGSRLLDSDSDHRDVDERVSSLFPFHVDIKPPEEESHLDSWRTQMEEDIKKIQILDNRNHIIEVLSANDLDCDDLSSICQADTMILSNYIEEIIVSAVSYHLNHNKDPEYKNGKLVLSSKSLSHGLSIFQESGFGGKETLKLEDDMKGANGSKKPDTEKSTTLPLKDGDGPLPPQKPEIPDNEFEKRIRPEVIPASEIGVTFDDIGALADIKESLQELVMLPLRRPDLFKGGLLKPCRGILLFGPPGTGKTMLAKAIANDAGASFINVSMSTITSKWFGEDEKNVRALFSLAAKVAPTIIFVDEVDSMLGQRARCGEHEAMRKIKNEFMSHWDGLLSKSGERILVLAATNRPFDLDQAIIRRFERRIMVGLPTLDSRELILRTLLSKEKVDEGIDFKELATMTEGYSGSDLKNLCVTAAYRPVRELLKREREKEMERRANEAKEKGATAENSGNSTSKKENPENPESKEKESSENKEEKTESKPENSEAKAEGGDGVTIDLRPLTMEDLRQAKNQVAASFAAEGAVMNELKQWNDLYGEGGSRKKQQLTYFL